MGHIAHLRNSSNQLKHLMRKAKQTSTLIKNKNHCVIFENWMVLCLRPFHSHKEFVEIDLGSLYRKIFNTSSMYFRYFIVISHLKRAWPLSAVQPRMLCAILIENVPVVLEKIFNFRQCIFNITLLFPLEKGVSLLESPLPMDTLFQRLY